MPLTVLIDGHFVGSVEARGVTWITPNGAAMPKVEFSMTPEQWSEFLHDFTEANEMTVQFNSGNEGSWTAKMVGSRDAAKGFSFCIDYVEKRSTQPYAATPPTQPYQQPDNTVTPKQVKPTRETVKKKDDGSI